MSTPLYSRSGRHAVDRGSGNETPGSTGGSGAAPSGAAVVPESARGGGGVHMDRAVGGSLLGCSKILADVLVDLSILGIDDILKPFKYIFESIV